MKEVADYLYEFDSTGRQFSTHGMDGISITKDGSIRYGYDGYVEFEDEEYDLELGSFNPTQEEKRELALFMIDKWRKYGDINLKITD